VSVWSHSCPSNFPPFPGRSPIVLKSFFPLPDPLSSLFPRELHVLEEARRFSAYSFLIVFPPPFSEFFRTQNLFTRCPRRSPPGIFPWWFFFLFFLEFMHLHLLIPQSPANLTNSLHLFSSSLLVRFFHDLFALCLGSRYLTAFTMSEAAFILSRSLFPLLDYFFFFFHPPTQFMVTSGLAPIDAHKSLDLFLGVFPSSPL